MEWPKYYPKECPPADSIEAKGWVFRIIKRRKPAEIDFKTHWEKYPKYQEDWLKCGEACESCGISVFLTIDDATMVKNTIRHLGDYIASANLNGNSGKLKHTPSDQHTAHHTWWVPLSVEKPWEIFTAVA